MEYSSEAVNKIVDSVEVPKDSDTFTSKNGIVFKIKKISILLIMDAVKKIERPKPPVVMIEEKGRMEENPSDPTYQELVQQYNIQRGALVSTLILAFGNEVTNCPGNIPTIDSDEWEDDIALFGLDVPKKGKARRAAWIKYVALDDDDIATLIRSTMRISGITMEDDVQEVMQSFRGDKARDTT